MSSKAIREFDAKLLVNYWLARSPPAHENAKVTQTFMAPQPKVAQISWDPETNAISSDQDLPSWVNTTKLVAKPDQLIKRRGKAGLLKLNCDWPEAKQWILERAGKPQKVSRMSRDSTCSPLRLVLTLIPFLAPGRVGCRHAEQLHRRAAVPAPCGHRVLRLHQLGA